MRVPRSWFFDRLCYHRWAAARAATIEEASPPMSTTKIFSLAALMVLLAIGPSAAQPAADPAAKSGAKGGQGAGNATAPKLTKQQAKQQAKEAARQAKIEARKAEKQAAKQAEKQARLAERKGQQGENPATGRPQQPTKVPGLAEKTGRAAAPPAPSNKGGVERGLDRAAGRASEEGLEKGAARGGAASPGATMKAKAPKGRSAN